MRDAKVFAKSDLSSGYWHVELYEASSNLTTFQTCFSRYRQRQIPFDLNYTAEIFQRKLMEQFQDMKGTDIIADDLVVYGMKQEYDRWLYELFQKCRNLREIRDRPKRHYFHGASHQQGGYSVWPRSEPSLTCQYHRLLETGAHFSAWSTLLENLFQTSQVLMPLYDLTKKYATWTWSESQLVTFDMARDLISTAPVPSYYDPDKETTLENNAWEYGLKATLIQEERKV